MSTIFDFMKAFAEKNVAGDVSRPGGMPGFDQLVQRGGGYHAAQQQAAPTISTPQEYWLSIGQGKTSKDEELEKLLGIGSQNALASYLPFLGLK